MKHYCICSKDEVLIWHQLQSDLNNSPVQTFTKYCISVRHNLWSSYVKLCHFQENTGKHSLFATYLLYNCSSVPYISGKGSWSQDVVLYICPNFVTHISYLYVQAVASKVEFSPSSPHEVFSQFYIYQLTHIFFFF